MRTQITIFYIKIDNAKNKKNFMSCFSNNHKDIDLSKVGDIF